MASISQFHSNFTFPTQYHHHFSYGVPRNPIMPQVGSDNCAMWNGEDLLNPLIYENGIHGFEFDHHTLYSSPEYSDTTSPIMAASLMPENVGISNNNLSVAFSSDFNNIGLDGAYLFEGIMHNSNDSNISGGGGGYHIDQLQHNVIDFGEECCGLVMHEFNKPFGSFTATDNLGIQSDQMQAIEEPNMKVTRYSEEERKERIDRYLKKRNRRNFNKTIKYACRKTLADRRVRVRGRFAKRNNGVCNKEINIMEDNLNFDSSFKLETDQLYCDTHTIQAKYDDEDWVQEAMASLLCMPNYVAAG